MTEPLPPRVRAHLHDVARHLGSDPDASEVLSALREQLQDRWHALGDEEAVLDGLMVAASYGTGVPHPAYLEPSVVLAGAAPLLALASAPWVGADGAWLTLIAIEVLAASLAVVRLSTRQAWLGLILSVLVPTTLLCLAHTL